MENHAQNEGCKQQFVGIKEQMVEVKESIKEIKADIKDVPVLSVLVEQMTLAFSKQSDTTDKLNDTIIGMKLALTDISNNMKDLTKGQNELKTEIDTLKDRRAEDGLLQPQFVESLLSDKKTTNEIRIINAREKWQVIGSSILGVIGVISAVLMAIFK